MSMPSGDVLREMAERGMTRKEMAEELCVTPSKVDHHLRVHDIRTTGNKRLPNPGIGPVKRSVPSQKALRMSSPWRMAA